MCLAQRFTHKTKQSDNVLVELARAMERLSLPATRIIIAYHKRDDRERKFFNEMTALHWVMNEVESGLFEFRKIQSDATTHTE